MSIDGIVATILFVLFVGGLGGLFISDKNTQDKQRDCRVELSKQTRLDTANIILICNGVK